MDEATPSRHLHPYGPSATPLDYAFLCDQVDRDGTLDLSRLQLLDEQLPANLQRPPIVTALNLSRNALKFLPECLASWSPLRSLNLSGNPIEAIPDDVDLLPNLVQLDCRQTRVRRFSGRIRALRRLEVFALTGGSIEWLPDGLGLCRELQFVDLSDNKLTHLCPSFYELSRLRHLSLSGNRFRTLPAQLAELGSLETFDASANPLERAPWCLLELPNLREIRLSSATLPPTQCRAFSQACRASNVSLVWAL